MYLVQQNVFYRPYNVHSSTYKQEPKNPGRLHAPYYKKSFKKWLKSG